MRACRPAPPPAPARSRRRRRPCSRSWRSRASAPATTSSSSSPRRSPTCGRRRAASSTPFSRGSTATGSRRGARFPERGRPAKQLYKLTVAGRAALDAWLAEVVPGDRERLELQDLRRRPRAAGRARRAGGAVPRATRRSGSRSCARSRRRTRAAATTATTATSSTSGSRTLRTSVRWADAVLADLRR